MKLSGPQYLLISEVFYDTPGTDSDEEWIEIYNPTSFAIDLGNYKLGDEETQGGTEGMYRFPAGASIAAGQKITVALRATGFFALHGFNPTYEVIETDASVPNMSVYSAWSTGTIALVNTGDEVLLLNGSDIAVDVVTFEGGIYPGVTPHPGVASGHSIERSPASQDTNDCSVDFVDRNPPTPGN
ncbi:MAG: lamin tail domain-containing protein [Chloroflexota bacterium]